MPKTVSIPNDAFFVIPSFLLYDFYIYNVAVKYVTHSFVSMTQNKTLLSPYISTHF